jgi:hypothetical protein
MTARRIAAAVAALALTLGAVAVSAPAQAGDTSWGQFKGGNTMKKGIE